MRIVRFILTACAVASLPACVVSSGRLESNRYQHATYPYALFYAPTGRADSPLGPHYTLENFRSPDGHHRYEKAGEGFTVVRDYADKNPPVKQGELFYDLLLSRDTPPHGQLWLRSVPLRKTERDAPLSELAGRYLDSAAQVDRVAAPIGLEVVESRGEKALLRNVKELPCTLSKREALRIDFELQNRVASAQPQPEWLSGSVVLIRSGYVTHDDYPVLILAGRSVAVGEQASIEADFDRMLERLVLGDKGQGLSMKGGHTCHADGVGTAPPAENAAPAQPSSGAENTVQQLEVPIIQEDAAPLPADGASP